MAIARWSIRPRGQRSRPSRRTTRWGFSLAIGCGTTTGRRRPCHRYMYRPRGHRARRQRGHRRPPVARCGPRTGWRSPPRRSSGFGRSCWHGRHRTLERLLPQRRHPRRLLSSRATAATAGSRRSSRPTPHGTRQRAQPVRELGPPPRALTACKNAAHVRGVGSANSASVVGRARCATLGAFPSTMLGTGAAPRPRAQGDGSTDAAGAASPRKGTSAFCSVSAPPHRCCSMGSALRA